MTGTRRRRAERFGRWAEACCAGQLRLLGYRIIDRRLKTPVGEIDIVARRGQSLAIIEVKARRHGQSGILAITRRQRQRLQRATEWLLAGRPALADLEIRFDVMLVAPWRPPHHMRDAWRPE